jgi:ABC-type amino acid transport substrate-binding protein
MTITPSTAAGTSLPLDTLASHFAPTGTLRACINLGNPILANRDTATGKVFGVSVDMAEGLAKRLGRELTLVVVDAAAKSVAAVTDGAADIGFFAIDPVRGAGIQFTPPYVNIEGAYMVRNGSALKANNEVDRAGTRVVVGRGSAYDLYLTRELKAAELVRTTRSQDVADHFIAEKMDVAAGVRQQMEGDALRIPGVRLLPGRFMVIHQAMGLPKSRSEAAQAYLYAYVEEMKASGFVKASLARHAIEGAAVAPAGMPA